MNSAQMASLGTGLALAGFAILFFTGAPFKARSRGLGLLATGEIDEAERAKERRLDLGSWAGFCVSIVGFGLQLLAAYSPLPPPRQIDPAWVSAGAAVLQAVGNLAAVSVALGLFFAERARKRRQDVVDHNELVALCLGLARSAHAATLTARDVLLGSPDHTPGNATPQLGPLRTWANVLRPLHDALAAVPRERFRDPILSFQFAKLLGAVDTSWSMGFASAHITSARDVVNMAEIELAAIAEAIADRRR